MPFISPPRVVIEPDGCTFRLVEPAHYIGKFDNWEVPAGFQTDLASIPAIVAWAIPKLGAYTQAAIVHDAFCEALAGRLALEAAPSPRDADAVFRRIMREGNVDVVTRWLVWTGVRWGALFNPIRRPGWHRDAPAVLAISILAAPVVVPASVLAVGGRLVLRAVSKLANLFR